MSMSSQTSPGQIDPEAMKSIVGAVYPALLSEPSTVRARSQAAYTIASAIATALIAADKIGALPDVERGEQVRNGRLIKSHRCDLLGVHL
jgi:hypothetical protein